MTSKIDKIVWLNWIIRYLKWQYLILAAMSLFIFLLVRLIPYQNDDIWINIYHNESFTFILNFFKWSYLNHSSRPGDLLAILLADNHKLFYPLFSATWILLTVITIFLMGLGRLPLFHQNKMQDTLILGALFCSFFIFPTSTGTRYTLLTVADGANHLLALIPAMLLIPYLNLIRKKNIADNKVWALIFFIFGLLAGFTVENIPPAIAVVSMLCLILYKIKFKEKIPFWSITAILGLIIGWLFIVLAPGPHVRLLTYNSDIAFKYATNTSFIMKVIQSFRITAYSLIQYSFPLVLVFIFLLIATGLQLCNLTIPLLLFLVFWLGNQAISFALGLPAAHDTRYGTSLFILASIVNLAEPYFTMQFRKISIALSLIIITVLPIYAFQAVLVHAQEQYKNQLIIAQRDHLPIIIPGYSYPLDLNLVIKNDSKCISFTKVCIFSLPPNSVKILDAKTFFIQDYVSFATYLKAQPVNKVTGLVLNLQTRKVIDEMRWYPIKITLPQSTGYQHLSIKGVLFVVVKTKDLGQPLVLNTVPEILYPLYQMTKLPWFAMNKVILNNYPGNIKFNLPDGRTVIAMAI